jgi:hypothetical protein
MPPDAYDAPRTLAEALAAIAAAAYDAPIAPSRRPKSATH